MVCGHARPVSTDCMMRPCSGRLAMPCGLPVCVASGVDAVLTNKNLCIVIVVVS